MPLGEVPLDAFEKDWEKQWLIERGVEIIFEASRRLTDEFKARHPDVPREKVADIGNMLRHNYETVAPAIMWPVAREDLFNLERICWDELAAARK